ncbi:MAG: hypothetical protein ABI626_09960 [Sphingomicrobium sp.]
MPATISIGRAPGPGIASTHADQSFELMMPQALAGAGGAGTGAQAASSGAKAVADPKRKRWIARLPVRAVSAPPPA